VANTVPIPREILLWALSRNPQDAEVLMETVPHLKEWLAGNRHPTLPQLKDLARRSHTPLGFFFLPEPPSDDLLPIPYFRTLEEPEPRPPSIDLLETVIQMQRRQDWMRDFLIAEGSSPLPWIGRAHHDMPLATIVDIVRNTLTLDPHWATQTRHWQHALDLLCDAIERTGVLVMGDSIAGDDPRRRLDPNEFRGFTLVDPYAPLIFVNHRDLATMQMFTVAHAFAHIVLNESAVFDLRDLQSASDPREQVCHRVAREFLVPAQALREFWTEPASIPSLTQRFRVSPITIAQRALDLDLMHPAQGFTDDPANGSRASASPSHPDEPFHRTTRSQMGLSFSRAIVQSVREETTLYSEAYRLTGLKREAFEKHAESITTESKNRKP